MQEKEKVLKLNSKKHVAAFVVSLAALCIVLCFGCVKSNNIAFADAESEGFIITDYRVKVNVTEDRIYRITEDISCDFSESRHGIYRSIPTAFRFKRADGSTNKMSARIKNFKADTDWETDGGYESNGSALSYYTVRLGDPDITVTGKQRYRISYDYVCSPDTLPDADEFYYNIIGNGWDTDIEHVSFSIRMPDAFDIDAVGFSMGYTDTAGVPAGELSSGVSDREISGETLRSLEPGEALTIRVTLPDGYFVSEQGIGYLWIYFITFILALVSVILCLRFGRDDKIVPTIQFDAPEGYNSLDVGVMDHLDARESDILSLLVYLAHKGYIGIEPLPKKFLNVIETQNYRFHKLREYDGNNECERMFMNGLFGGCTSVDSKNLEGYFYTTVKDIAYIEKDFTSKLVWRRGRIPITFLILAGLMLMAIPFISYGGFFDYLVTLTGRDLIGMGVGAACIIVMIVCWGMIQRRTPLGVELAGQARGFAEFIETAEKDRIEQMIEEDPESFYRIIPYAMALGITDKWISKFKGIALERPSWYMYDDPYIDGYILGHMLGTTLETTMKDVSVAPESSGGGGISAGGAGGGGGGSW